jgi:hypothetical protein
VVGVVVVVVVSSGGSSQTRTQTANRALRFPQFAFMPGFSCKNSVVVIPNSAAMPAQVSPVPTRCHLLHWSGTGEVVGPGGSTQPSGVMVSTVGRHEDAASVGLGRIGSCGMG